MMRAGTPSSLEQKSAGPNGRRSSMTRGSANRKWAVFISGRGSNLQALLDQASVQDIRWVFSSKASAQGLLRARRAGVPFRILSKQMDWRALSEDLKRSGVTHLFLAGFMKMVPAFFVEDWAGRMVNVHPSLLPAYPGLNSLEKAFQDSQDLGATVHVVTAEMDAGPILVQKKFMSGIEVKKSTLEDAQLRLSQVEQMLVRTVGAKWG